MIKKEPINIENIIDLFKSDIEKSLFFFKNKISKITAIRLNPKILEDLKINYNEKIIKLSEVSNISSLNYNTLIINVWDKQLLEYIKKSILDSNIGVTPLEKGNNILIRIPPITQERRLNIVKNIKIESENNKINLRNLRKEYLKKMKMG